MKYVVYLLTLAASQSVSCELADVDTLRKDVEAAFMARSFAGIATAYGSSSLVELKLENEYDDESPVTTFKFKSLSELSAWFYEKHQYGHMTVPERVTCGNFNCEYEIPELTLHHGTYLLGFKGNMVGKCISLVQVSIHWG